MRSVLTNLLAGLLLVQAFTGWCDRSSHDCRQPCHAGENHCSDVYDCGHLTQHSLRHCGQSPSDRDNERPCHGVCTYIPTSKVHVDSLQLGFDFVAGDIAMTGRQLLTRSDLERAGVSVESEPPLRLHLWHQVLLI